MILIGDVEAGSLCLRQEISPLFVSFFAVVSAGEGSDRFRKVSQDNGARCACVLPLAVRKLLVISKQTRVRTH